MYDCGKIKKCSITMWKIDKTQVQKLEKLMKIQKYVDEFI